MKGTYDLVLGAGGVKGYHHIGALRAIKELGVPIGTVTGVSVGSAVATLYTNGWDAEAILAEFDRGQYRVFDPSFWARSIIVPTPVQWLTSASAVSLRGGWAEIIERYGLKPNDQLQILAHCHVDGEPILFKGHDYDLATAVAASGSVQTVFAPQILGHHVLVDGAFYHYNPTEFSDAPAIVVRLNRATRWPNELLNPVDAYFHWRELYLPLLPSKNNVDSDKHIVIDMESPDVAGLSFGISQRRRLQMVEDGYRTTHQVLSRAIEDGRIVLPHNGSGA